MRALSAVLAAALLLLAADDWALRRQARAGALFWHGDPEVPAVALTFDDGPNEPYTSELLAVLRAEGVKATFFVVGRNAEREPASVAAVAREGHALGNHSYSHADLLLETDAQVERQLARAEEAIARASGERPSLFRPPFGLDDALTLRASRRLGFTAVKWSVSSKDWTRPGVDRIVARVLAQVRGGSIVLLHDGNECHGGDRSQTVEAVRRLIPELKRRGYRLVTVPELLRLRGGTSGTG